VTPGARRAIEAVGSPAPLYYGPPPFAEAALSDGGSGRAAEVAEEGLSELLRRRVLRLLDELGGGAVEGLYTVVMREAEKGLLQAALERAGGRRERAAALLGLHRNSLRRRLRETGLERAEEMR